MSQKQFRQKSKLNINCNFGQKVGDQFGRIKNQFAHIIKNASDTTPKPCRGLIEEDKQKVERLQMKANGWSNNEAKECCKEIWTGLNE